jgi:predicted GIY-YIG superfamily endonuclease
MVPSEAHEVCEGGLLVYHQATGSHPRLPGTDTVHYTYVLESVRNPGTRYIGQTSNLSRRLEAHNAGKCQHTAKHRPWKLVLYVAFETRPQACHFERYLESGSGHAFANRHFWR